MSNGEGPSNERALSESNDHLELDRLTTESPELVGSRLSLILKGLTKEARAQILLQTPNLLCKVCDSNHKASIITVLKEALSCLNTEQQIDFTKGFSEDSSLMHFISRSNLLEEQPYNVLMVAAGYLTPDEFEALLRGLQSEELVCCLQPMIKDPFHLGDEPSWEKNILHLLFQLKDLSMIQAFVQSIDAVEDNELVTAFYERSVQTYLRVNWRQFRNALYDLFVQVPDALSIVIPKLIEHAPAQLRDKLLEVGIYLNRSADAPLIFNAVYAAWSSSKDQRRDEHVAQVLESMAAIPSGRVDNSTFLYKFLSRTTSGRSLFSWCIFEKHSEWARKILNASKTMLPVEERKKLFLSLEGKRQNPAEDIDILQLILTEMRSLALVEARNYSVYLRELLYSALSISNIEARHDIHAFIFVELKDLNANTQEGVLCAPFGNEREQMGLLSMVLTRAPELFPDYLQAGSQLPKLARNELFSFSDKTGGTPAGHVLFLAVMSRRPDLAKLIFEQIKTLDQDMQDKILSRKFPYREQGKEKKYNVTELARLKHRQSGSEEWCVLLNDLNAHQPPQPRASCVVL